MRPFSSRAGVHRAKPCSSSTEGLGGARREAVTTLPEHILHLIPLLPIRRVLPPFWGLFGTSHHSAAEQWLPLTWQMSGWITCFTCFTTCENRYFSPVLQSLNFDEERFVGKEVIGLPKETQEFLPSAAGRQWERGSSGFRVPGGPSLPQQVFGCSVNGAELISKKPMPSNIDWDFKRLWHSELFRAYSNFFLNCSIFQKTQRKVVLMFLNNYILHHQGFSNCNRRKKGSILTMQQLSSLGLSPSCHCTTTEHAILP